VNSNDENLNKIFSFAKTSANTARYSLDSSKVLIKLKHDDTRIYQELSNYIQCSSNLSELETEFWRINPFEI
tara:strand:- start:45425 stop:45640 length:216 start_codon:yes stop_codon:yes gene_type:complete